MADDKSRAQFEAFIRRQPLLGYSDGAPLERLGAGYLDAQVDDNWRTWQASRAALVVELPQALRQSSMTSAGESFASIATLNACRDAIRAAGVATK